VVLLGAGCADGRSNAGIPATPFATTAEDGPVRWDGQGAGSWQGARTDGDGSTVLVAMVGAREHDPADPCSTAYHVEVTETEAEVRLRLGESSPVDHRPPPTAGAYACTAEGHLRIVTVHLASPLDGRQLIEEPFGRAHPVFDGASLVTIGWLPEGWELLGEGAPFGGADTVEWARTYGPPRRSDTAPDGRPCWRGTAGVTLTQGPSTGGADPPTGDDVGGAPASYVDDGSSHGLVWSAGATLFQLRSAAVCAGDVLPTKDLLLQIARSIAPA
jgi:hypothetical protein